MSLKDEMNQQLRELWKDNWTSAIWKENNQNGGLKRLWPHQYHDLKYNCLVFVGLNPSFKVADWLGESTFVKLDNVSDLDDPAKLANLEFAAKVRINGISDKKPYPYYDQFKNIAGSMGTDWQPIEVFCVREPNQNVVKKYLGLDSGKSRNPTDFAKKQWDIFWNILSEIQPSAVVVANALASKLIMNPGALSSGESQKFKLEFDETSGDYYLESSHGKTPIFFSGMISGKRPLDIGSRERLLWHVKTALKR